jgi:hypothetical protein
MKKKIFLILSGILLISLLSSFSSASPSNWTVILHNIDGDLHHLKQFNNSLWLSFAYHGQINFFNGTDWNMSKPSGVNEQIQSLEVYNNKLYAGGCLLAGNDGNLWVFNGTDWSVLWLASGMKINALTTYNGELYIGGTIPSFPPSAFVYKYNGSDIINAELPDSKDRLIYPLAMIVHNGKLYVGSGSGDISEAHKKGKIYAYNGSWSVSYESSYTKQYFISFGEYEGNLYAGLSPNKTIYKLDDETETWSVHSTLPQNPFAFKEYRGNFFVGTDTGEIYLLNGSNWSLDYDTPDSIIHSFEEYQGYLFAGGNSSGLRRDPHLTNILVVSPLNQTYSTSSIQMVAFDLFTTPIITDIFLNDVGSDCYCSANLGENISMDAYNSSSNFNKIITLAEGSNIIVFSCKDISDNWAYATREFNIRLISKYIRCPPNDKSNMCNMLRGGGAGMGLFFEHLTNALPDLAFALAFVLIITGILFVVSKILQNKVIGTAR